MILAEAQSVVSIGAASPGGADFNVLKLQPSIVWRATPKIAIRAGGLFEIAASGLTPGNGAFLALWTEF
ncbi:MAG: hypothetical protein GC152_13095 [Alphaproteobacteria bacterium]|nr:hypothetical protein [Alphaproteobacteria bacterium]